MRNAKAFIQRLGIIVLFCAMSNSSWANVIYVKAGATGAKNGTSWTNAYTDLQAALAAAQWGDDIWVAAGTYKPTTGTDRTKSFVMTAGVAIYGGFIGSETTRSQRNWRTYPTILSGDIGVLGNNSDNSYHVISGGYMATIDGFTVTLGFTSDRGAGMINDSVSPIITNCTFSNNTAKDSVSVKGLGGGMYNKNASPIVTNCNFINNTAIGCSIYGTGNGGWGGGMYSYQSFPTVTNCYFSGNSASYGGGGMYNANKDSEHPSVTNCTFDGNSAGSLGGGMCNDLGGSGFALAMTEYLSRCAFINNSAGAGGGVFNMNVATSITNCVFVGNTANATSGMGGGGICNACSSSIVTNCSFWGNSSASNGGAIANAAAGATIKNCLLWQNNAPVGPECGSSEGLIKQSFFFNCLIRGCGGSGSQWNPVLGIDGGGNIMADPLFVNASSPVGPDGIWKTGDDGLRLQTGSPCINAGLAAGAPATDIVGNPRVGVPDIGAYEYSGSTPTPTPPTTPEGRLALSYTITKASTAPAGKTVQYTYRWTSDKGDSVTHGPTTALADTLTEMNLVQAGETWTVTVTPSYDTTSGTPASAKVKILSPQNNVNQWILYK